jgi:hypothetical protein
MIRNGIDFRPPFFSLLKTQLNLTAGYVVCRRHHAIFRSMLLRIALDALFCCLSVPK